MFHHPHGRAELSTTRSSSKQQTDIGSEPSTAPKTGSGPNPIPSNRRTPGTGEWTSLTNHALHQLQGAPETGSDSFRRRRSTTNSILQLSGHGPYKRREAVALSGPQSAAGNSDVTEQFQTGTRAMFTAPGWRSSHLAGPLPSLNSLSGAPGAHNASCLIPSPSLYGSMIGSCGGNFVESPSNPPAGDSAEEELISHCRELEEAVGMPNESEILLDFIEAVESRSSLNLDINARDVFLEHCIRDLLNELRHMDSEGSLLLSVKVIEWLLPLEYTAASTKFVRLYRSLCSIMQCSFDAPRKEAKRVYGLMLTLDAAYLTDSPLKTHIEKDLQEQIGVANLQLQMRTVVSRKLSSPHLLYFVMSVEELSKVTPRFVSTPLTLRDDIIRIVSACCVSDLPLEQAAYSCLEALFRNSSLLTVREIVRESQMVSRKCEMLNSARYNETTVICQLRVLRALFTSRPEALPGERTKIAAAVTTLFTPGKSPNVRMAVCDLLPIVAPWDIHIPSRRSAYCAMVMEPLKNVRDNRRKSKELENIAIFIKAVGYDVLDAASRTNLDSILLRYITQPESHEACWKVISVMLSHPSGTLESGRPSVAFPTPVTNASPLVSQGFGAIPPMQYAPLEPTTARATSTSVPASTTKPDSLVPPSDASCPRSHSTSPSVQSSRSAYPPSATEDPLIVPSEIASQVNPPWSGEGSDTLHFSPPQLGLFSTRGSVDTSQHKLGSDTTLSMSNGTPSTYGSPPKFQNFTMDDLLSRCIPCIHSAPLTSELVRLVRSVAEQFPYYEKAIQQELHKLADETLSEAVVAQEKAKSQVNKTEEIPTACGTPSARASSASPSQPRSQTSGENTVAMSSAQLSVITNRWKGLICTPFTAAAPESTPNTWKTMLPFPQVSPSSPEGSPITVTEQRTTKSMETEQHSSSSHNDSLGLLQLQPAQTMSDLPPVSRENDLAVAIELLAERKVVEISQLEERSKLVNNFLHSKKPAVRRAVFRAVTQILDTWIRYAREKRESSHSTIVISIMESYIKNIPSEASPSIQVESEQWLSENSVFHPYLLDSRVVSVLRLLLCSSSHSRNIAVRIIRTITVNIRSSFLAPLHQVLSVSIESAVVQLEHSEDNQLLLGGLEALRSFASLDLRFFSSQINRVFTALRKRLTAEEVPEIISLSILSTLKCFLKSMNHDERALFRYEDEILSLYAVVVDTLFRNASHGINLSSISVLVELNRMLSYPSQNVDPHALLKILTSVYISTNSTRREIADLLTLFGQLGAIDPSLEKAPSSRKPLSGERIAAPAPHSQKQGGSLPEDSMWVMQHRLPSSVQIFAPSQDYTVVVYEMLCHLLITAQSEVICLQALHTLLQFIRFTQDQQEYVDGILAVQYLIQVIRRSKSESTNLYVEALRVLVSICNLRRQKIVPVMLQEIVMLLDTLWIPSDFQLFSLTLDVVCALKPGKLSEREHSESWEWLFPRLMDVAVQDHSETKELCLRVVEIILTASYIPLHCAPIIFPVLIRFIQQHSLLAEVRSQSLCAAIHLLCDLKFSQYTCALLHSIRTIKRHAESQEYLRARCATVTVLESLKVLSAFLPSARAVIRPFAEFLSEYRASTSCSPFEGGHSGTAAPPFNSSTAVHFPNLISVGHRTPSGIHSKNGNGERGSMRLITESSVTDEEKDEPEFDVPESMPPAGSHDIGVFLKHIDWGMSRKRMRAWFSELQKYIILVSPHPAIRLMTDLASKHEPLRRDLFNSAFKAIYEVLTADQIIRVNTMMSLVLNSSENDLGSQCLALSDYLDHNPPRIRPEVLEDLKAREELEKDPPRGEDRSRYDTLNASGMSDHGFSGGTHSSLASPFFSAPSTSFHPNEANPQASNLSINSLGNESPVPPMCSLANHIATLGSELSALFTLPSGRHWKNTSEGSDLQGVLETPGTTLHYLSPVGRAPLHPYPNTQVNLYTPHQIVRAAEKTQLYDKSINYFENLLLQATARYGFDNLPGEVMQAVVLPLAWLYSKQDMRMSVMGLLRAVGYKGDAHAGSSFELLGAWEDAQKIYAAAIGSNIRSAQLPIRLVEGYIQSLVFSAEWTKAFDVAQSVAQETLQSSFVLSQCGATSAWVLGRWDEMLTLSEPLSVSELNLGKFSHLFQHVVLLQKAIKNNSATEFDSLRSAMLTVKLSLDESIRALLPLGYTQAYSQMELLQHYTEMDELIDYYTSRNPRRLTQLIQRWEGRFHLLKSATPQPKLNTLLIFSLVLPCSTMSSMILHFCESIGDLYPRLAQWSINWLQEGKMPHSASSLPVRFPFSMRTTPEVQIGYIRYIWAHGERQEAIQQMDKFLRASRSQLETQSPKVFAAAHLRLGRWKKELLGIGRAGEHVPDEFEHYYRAIRADPSSFEAWYNWALVNYRAHQQCVEDGTVVVKYVEAAHQGFTASICRCQCPMDALPSIMRLLQLWVIYDGVAMLKEMVADMINRIPVDYWVQAIPQLFGHLANESYDIREVISVILRRLCEKHPQAVIFPLVVISTADDEHQELLMSHTESSYLSSTPSSIPSAGPQSLKKELVRSIIQYCPKQLRAEAETVAKLLVDVSAIPIEKIREHLSEVAAAWNPYTEYEPDRDDVSRRLHMALELFTIHRRHLLYTVGDIGQFIQIVMEHDAAGETVKAQGIVKQLIEEISKHISQKLGKEPQKAMEPLLRLRNLSIAVFGEYSIGNPFPTITSFSSALEVIPSKKRPRKIQLSGSDGRTYMYCLKGNEDIRMDERVMQLFGMVNVLLLHSRVNKAGSIQRFPVIPISGSVGLLGWLQKAVTINSIVCDYRENVSHIRPHHESTVLRNYVNSIGYWERLSIIQRAEVFDYVMREPQCSAMDVANAMWLCANNAEEWLDRRNTYTVSLAVMSMVGYVLGLGDRHLGNIMLSMTSGKAIHIDFGDSFDVSRLRHVLPETTPFRLTRMLSNAMEVFGVNGSFRASSIQTQNILRLERDSIMSLLSAFVHDPIIQHKGKLKNVMEKSRSPHDLIERIRHKLHGSELAVKNEELTLYYTTPESTRRPDLLYMSKAFDAAAARIPSMALDTEDQVNYLIDEATRPDNFTVLFVGWGPLW